eukprot:SAG31_NODE_13988_length_833_cov_1.013624_1_plen_54_part_01
MPDSTKFRYLQVPTLNKIYGRTLCLTSFMTSGYRHGRGPSRWSRIVSAHDLTSG